MKIILYLSILLIFIQHTFGQENNHPIVTVNLLSPSQVKEIFTDSVKKIFSIDYNMFRTYCYTDKTGKYYVALTERIDSITPDKDTLNHKIKAFNFKSTAKGLEKQWEINDFTIKQTNKSGNEKSIWFWTKYSVFQDLENNGIVDPIVVYGTLGTNGYEDGRIKILVFYKGQKIALRHQNGALDFERNTQVDQTFYSLPLTIQDYIKELMEKMVDNGHAIFPYGWQNAMQKHELKFEENH